MLLVANLEIIDSLQFIGRLEDKLEQKVLYNFHSYDLFNRKLL